LAVIDFETTGLSPGYDRAVELAIIRIDPGDEPRPVFDSLIHPCRGMAASEIHGLTDRDVRDAPPFSELVPEILSALSGCVIAAHNATFDLRFLCFELGLPGRAIPVPFVCTRYARGLISRKPLGLESACLCDGIPFRPTHSSRLDAMAAARLWVGYVAEFERLGLDTFEALTALGKSYKFIQSFRFPTLVSPCEFTGETRQKPRRAVRLH
jgi:DNA polymerase-3 subunit epsilon